MEGRTVARVDCLVVVLAQLCCLDGAHDFDGAYRLLLSARPVGTPLAQLGCRLVGPVLGVSLVICGAIRISDSRNLHRADRPRGRGTLFAQLLTFEFGDPIL